VPLWCGDDVASRARTSSSVALRANCPHSQTGGVCSHKVVVVVEVVGWLPSTAAFSMAVHTAAITHCGKAYDFGHLRPWRGSFTWTGEDGVQLQYAVSVRYTSHCYSYEDKGQSEPDGAFKFLDRNRKKRVFCLTRHGHSLALPEIFSALVAKPQTTIQLTHEDNWTVFRLQLPSKLEPTEKYWVFFRIKEDHKPNSVAVFVESAYPRTTGVSIRSRSPFGRVVARVGSGQKK